jgi:hypothetical protein
MLLLLSWVCDRPAPKQDSSSESSSSESSSSSSESESSDEEGPVTKAPPPAPAPAPTPTARPVTRCALMRLLLSLSPSSHSSDDPLDPSSRPAAPSSEPRHLRFTDDGEAVVVQPSSNGVKAKDKRAPTVPQGSRGVHPSRLKNLVQPNGESWVQDAKEDIRRLLVSAWICRMRS